MQIMWSLRDILCTYENVLDDSDILRKAGVKCWNLLGAWMHTFWQGDSFDCRTYYFLFDNVHCVLGSAETENS